MIPLNEQQVFLDQAVNLLPRGPSGRRVHHSTLLRWIRRGILVDKATGRKVFLEGDKLGSRWFTSVEALARFRDRTTGVLARDNSMLPRGEPDRKRSSERAGDVLECAGI